MYVWSFNLFSDGSQRGGRYAITALFRSLRDPPLLYRGNSLVTLLLEEIFLIFPKKKFKIFDFMNFCLCDTFCWKIIFLLLEIDHSIFFRVCCGFVNTIFCCEIMSCCVLNISFTVTTVSRHDDIFYENCNNVFKCYEMYWCFNSNKFSVYNFRKKSIQTDLKNWYLFQKQILLYYSPKKFLTEKLQQKFIRLYYNTKRPKK